eukprot:902451-Rhodomonas_salina.2
MHPHPALHTTQHFTLDRLLAINQIWSPGPNLEYTSTTTGKGPILLVTVAVDFATVTPPRQNAQSYSPVQKNQPEGENQYRKITTWSTIAARSGKSTASTIV